MFQSPTRVSVTLIFGVSEQMTYLNVLSHCLQRTGSAAEAGRRSLLPAYIGNYVLLFLGDMRYKMLNTPGIS
jgi:hypothetical protein